MTPHPFAKPYTAEVAAFHAKLAALTRWLIADGHDAEVLLDAIEKPWRWMAEADAAQALEEVTREWADR